MSFESMAWAVNQKCKNSSQKLVLLLLANHSNGYTGQCNPSHKLLADECCMSISSLKVQIKALSDAGFLNIIAKSRGAISLPNQYDLNISPVKSLDVEGSELNPPDLLGCDNKEGLEQVESGSQNLAGGGSESGYKPINKPVIETVIETLSLIPTQKKKMTIEQKTCFDWAKKHPFWKDTFSNISNFIHLYNNNAPKGLKAQFLANKEGTKETIKQRARPKAKSIKTTDYNLGSEGFVTNNQRARPKAKSIKTTDYYSLGSEGFVTNQPQATDRQEFK